MRETHVGEDTRLDFLSLFLSFGVTHFYREKKKNVLIFFDKEDFNFLCEE